jgi:predicted permease
MLQDARYALRQLLKSPGFTVVAVLTLALGIGVNATIFTLLSTILFKPAPFGHSADLFYVYSTSAQARRWNLSPGDANDIHRQNTVFERFAIINFSSPSLADPGQPAERVGGMEVSGDFLPMLQVPPALGRLFTPEEDRDGGAIVVSHHFWLRRLGGGPDAIGRVLRLDGKPVTVVGVMPESLDDPMTWGRVDLWQPLGYDAASWETRDSEWLRTLGRLKPGISVPQAQAEMDSIGAKLARDYPKSNAQKGFAVVNLNTSRIDGLGRRMSWLVMDLTIFVLLIACVNLANLQLARTTSQRREHAIRLALGSSPWRLIRQLLTESLIISLAGGALGLLVAHWGSAALGRSLLIDGSEGLDLPVNLQVVGFTFVVSALTGAAFGIVPAWLASRTDANAALKQGGRGTSGDKSRHRLRHALIVSEIAIAVALLAGAGYFVRGTQRMMERDYGWRPENLLMGHMVLPYEKYADEQLRRTFFDRLRADLGALPGVDRVFVSRGHPAGSAGDLGKFAVEGREDPGIGKEPMKFETDVTPGFFSTMGIRLQQGRDFSDGDRASTRGVVIVNETMARQLWPGENPIGKRIGATDPAHRDWREVVGVVNDITNPISLFVPPETRYQTYTPIYQSDSRWLSLTVRSTSDPHLLEESVHRIVAKLDPDLAVYGVETVQERMAHWMSNFTLVSWILSGMAALGLLLSSVGIYGVIANLAAQRTQEIGIRTALGAQRGDVLWLIMKNGVRVAAIGTSVGLALAFTLTFILARAMPEVPGQSTAGTFGLSAVIVAVALIACWLPARRATKVDPIIALRGD